VNLYTLIASNLDAVNVHGLLSDCRHPQFGYSNSCSGFAFRRYLAEREEKVSPARNNNAHSRCASPRSDISLDDTFIQQPIQSSKRSKPRRYTYGDNPNSRAHWNCGSYPWNLDGCFLAPASRHENLFRKKENNARHNGTMANITYSRHHPIPENYATILTANPQYPKLFLFPAKPKHHNNQYDLKKMRNSNLNYFRSYSFLRHLQHCN